LKNNPIVVGILVLGAIAVGLSQGLDIFKKVKETVSPAKAHITEVHISIQGFNTSGEYDGSPILRSPPLKDKTDFKAVAGDIAEAIANEIKPAQSQTYIANLEINGNILTSDQPVRANLIAVKVNNPVMQIGPRVQAADLIAGEDISQRFADSAFFSSDCNCIHLELDAPVDGYEEEPFDIFQYQAGYSFDANQMINKKSVLLNTSRVSVLIDFPQGQGVDEQHLSATEVTLDGAIRQQIQASDFMTISPYKTQAEYKAEIEKAIAALPLGGGKEDYLAQHGVKYIVTITFIMK
jgi:hypothetical protein